MRARPARTQSASMACALHNESCRPNSVLRRRSHRRSALGATLVEMLTVLGISTIVMGIGAAHFTTIRQVDDLVTERRVAQQRARVAMERICRYIRNAVEVVAITPSADSEGSITVRDNDGVEDVLEQEPGTAYLRAMVVAGTPYQLASEIESLHYTGYDTTREVPETEPNRIRGVKVKMVAKVVDSADTIAITSSVRLRKEVRDLSARSSISYATKSAITLGIGCQQWGLGYGEPDDQGAYLDKEDGEAYGGFQPGEYTGEVKAIFAGIRTEYKDHDLRVIVRHGSSILLDDTYIKESHLEPTKDTWVWRWLDITNSRASWTHEDIDDLSIEVRDPGSDVKCYFDCFAIRAFFDPIETTFVWASQEGTWSCTNEWTNGFNGTGALDGSYAQGSWDPELKQSYRATPPAKDDEILTVRMCINGYVPSAFTDDYMKARVERSTGETAEYQLYAADFAPFVGVANQGNIMRYVNHVAWTWEELTNHEIWFEPKRSGSQDSSLFADSVGWKIVHVPVSNQRTLTWSE